MTDKEIRIGQGVDIHPFVDGRPLILGGVSVPHVRGLQGHSDADVLLHAIIDALLGAIGEGDIGTLFPDTDSKWKNADSRDLTKGVVERVKEKGWSIVNIDSTVMTEAPKLKPHVPAIRESVSNLLEIDTDRCSVKATTSERMGFVGREEGILVHAVALLQK